MKNREPCTCETSLNMKDVLLVYRGSKDAMVIYRLAQNCTSFYPGILQCVQRKRARDRFLRRSSERKIKTKKWRKKKSESGRRACGRFVRYFLNAKLEPEVVARNLRPGECAAVHNGHSRWSRLQLLRIGFSLLPSFFFFLLSFCSPHLSSLDIYLETLDCSVANP